MPVRTEGLLRDKLSDLWTKAVEKQLDKSNEILEKQLDWLEK